MIKHPTVFIGSREVLRRCGKSRSALYREISTGIFPPPVRIGRRASAWPESEVEEIAHARMRGACDDELRTLVAEQIHRRSADVEHS